MSKTYYWDPAAPAGTWTDGGDWINVPAGSRGTVPKPGDFAEIGALSASVSVTLPFGPTQYIRSLAMGGTGSVRPTLDIDGGSLFLADNPLGQVTDSFSAGGHSYTGGGTIDLRHGGSLYVGGQVDADVNVNFDGTSDTLFIGGTRYGQPKPDVFAGNISGFGGSSRIVLAHVGYYPTIDSFSYNDGVLSIFGPSHVDLLNLHINAGSFRLSQFIGPSPGFTGYVEITVVCFAGGTHIRTPSGDVPIERIREGDPVLAMRDGLTTAVPVRWVGRRRIDLAGHPRPDMAAPVRIRAGAIAEGMPSRDLLLSPDHCIHLDGKLIPARLLLNGASIVQDLELAEVEYFHLELDRHAILLAEGVEAESYLDTGNRGFFANAGLPTELHPALSVNEASPAWRTQACAPLTLAESEVQPVWQRLAGRAAGLGHALPAIASVTDPALMLEAGGRLHPPVRVEGGHYVFVLPTQAATMRLVSRAASPAALRPWIEDRRILGVKVAAVTADGRALDRVAVRAGWWPAEADGCWTDGAAELRLAVPAARIEIDLVATLPGYPAPVLSLAA